MGHTNIILFEITEFFSDDPLTQVMVSHSDKVIQPPLTEVMVSQSDKVIRSDESVFFREVIGFSDNGCKQGKLVQTSQLSLQN